MKKYDTLRLLAYIYILLPFIIFLLGWTKFFLIGLPLSIAILICLIKLIGESKGDCQKKLFIYQGKDILYILIIIMLISAWVYSSGVGGYSYQNIDHEWRNEIFKILVDYKWPVTKDVIGGKRGMSYYIGFWMIPAIIGKIYGLSAGFFAQYIWAIIGIALTYQFICRRIGKIAIWPLIILILFSGLDIVGWILNGNGSYSLGVSIDGWKAGYQYSSMTTQLFWVFNQAIYGWLITLMVIEERNRRIVLLWGIGLFYAILPMLGLFPIVAVNTIKNSYEDKLENKTSFVKEFYKNSFTYENVIGLFCLMIIMSMFFGNAVQMLSKNFLIALISVIIGMIFIAFVGCRVIRQKYIWNSVKSKANLLRDSKVIKYLVGFIILIIWGLIVNKISPIGNEKVANNNICTYIEFLAIEVGGYIVLCSDVIRNNLLYKISVLVLMACPVFVIGSSIDFCMRVSIPAILMLYLAVIDSFRIENRTITIRLKKCILFIVISIGAVTAISEIYRSHQNRNSKTIEYVNSERIFERQNFSVDVGSSIFYKYFAAGQNYLFKHYNTITYSNWNEFESVGYYFDGQYAMSTASDPYIIFYCPEQVYQVELDIQWNSFLERQDKDGTEYSNAQIFWADESENFSEDNSKWIRLNYGRDSYVVDIECPPNTLYRVDVGEGENVQFDVYGITFKTVSEYTIRERLTCILQMLVMIVIVVVTGYRFCLKNKERFE